MQIELNDEQRQALADLLGETLPNLRSEVYKTENFEMREQLKRREAVLRVLLDRLAVPAEAPSKS